MAATATVEGRSAHSLHAYFLRRGDFNSPIVYEVDRARDGNHFSTRRVVAIQHGAQIFNLSASFQSPENGLDHQLPMPQVPPPETLETLETHLKDVLATLPPVMRRGLEQKRPFEFRLVEPPFFLRQGPVAPVRHVWFRAVDELPDDDSLHRCLLAYVSDFYLLDTALMPTPYRRHASSSSRASTMPCGFTALRASTNGCCMLPTARARPAPGDLPAGACSRATGGWSRAPHKKAYCESAISAPSGVCMKGLIIVAVVVAVIVGLLFTLRSSRNVGTPSRDVLDRAEERARTQAADEKDD